jgi:hypothetical protein
MNMANSIHRQGAGIWAAIGVPLDAAKSEQLFDYPDEITRRSRL